MDVPMHTLQITPFLTIEYSISVTEEYGLIKTIISLAFVRDSGLEGAEKVNCY